ncbi:MAG: 30S ribosomal protein S16 [Planctomycetota bacterium]|nr:MAG: 30S ribosomal protein S16 [Planctomycetota bacterium]
MAVKIRLQRHGRRNRPFFRIVAADARSPRDGKSIETLGIYDPANTLGKDAETFRLDVERVQYWLEHGAQPTETVRSILRKKQIALPWRARKMERRLALAAERKAARADGKTLPKIGSKAQRRKAEKAAMAKAAELGLDTKKARRAAKKAK